MVRLTEPLALETGTSDGAVAPVRFGLVFFRVPLSTRLPVPEPVTVTPPAVEPVRVPRSEERRVGKDCGAGSTSENDRTESRTAGVWLAPTPAGRAPSGESLNGAMWMVTA